MQDYAIQKYVVLETFFILIDIFTENERAENSAPKCVIT